MQFQEQNRYPYPAAAVAQVFRNPDYFIAKYRGAGARAIEVIDTRHEGEHSHIRVSRQVDIDIDVPAFARKFVPDTITVVQTDSWDQTSLRGRLDIRFKGMPAVVKCEMSLTDDNNEAVLDLAFSVHINVPLIGDKLARVFGEDLKKKFEKDSVHAQQVMTEFAPQYL